MSDDPVAVAIDIGGTKLAGCLVNRAGEVQHRRVLPTVGERPDDAESLWNVLANLVAGLLDAATGRPVVGLGVGSAGPLDLTVGAISPVNIPAWRAFPLVDRLAEAAPSLPVYLAGDGACAAAGEHWQGAARDLDDVMTIVVSTGVGGGLVQQGRLYAGQSGNAGHIGHIVVDHGGDRCPCGGYGCVEAYASGPSMVGWARRNGWRSGEPSLSAVELAADARDNHPVAVEAFQRAGRALAAGIVSAAAMCDLTHVFIGGGVAAAADLLLPPLREAYHRHAGLDFLTRVTIAPAELASVAGLVGSGAIVFHPERYGGRGVLHRPARRSSLRGQR
jgi:glucokinase